MLIGLSFDTKDFEYLPEAARQLDDDYVIEWEERFQQRKARQNNWYFDEECDDWAWDGEE